MCSCTKLEAVQQIQTGSRNAAQNWLDLILLSLIFEWYFNLQSTFINNSSFSLHDRSVRWILFFFSFCLFPDRGGHKISDHTASQWESRDWNSLFWAKDQVDFHYPAAAYGGQVWCRVLPRIPPWVLDSHRSARRGKGKGLGKEVEWAELWGLSRVCIGEEES